jgi:hypothetical protein
VSLFLSVFTQDQCESVIPSYQFPSSLAEVVHHYFVALPPSDPLTTPPPSPSEDEVGFRGAVLYSPQACEELAWLVYFITKSYLACRQSEFLLLSLSGANLHHSLNMQSNNHSKRSLDLVYNHTFNRIIFLPAWC